MVSETGNELQKFSLNCEQRDIIAVLCTGVSGEKRQEKTSVRVGRCQSYFQGSCNGLVYGRRFVQLL